MTENRAASLAQFRQGLDLLDIAVAERFEEFIAKVRQRIDRGEAMQVSLDLASAATASLQFAALYLNTLREDTTEITAADLAHLARSLIESGTERLDVQDQFDAVLHEFGRQPDDEEPAP